MPYTESQVVTWLWNNWPTVAVAVSAGTVYVVAYLRLHAFLNIVSSHGKQLDAFRQRLKTLRAIVQELAANHCSKYPLETKQMMDLLSKDEDPEGE